jgi:chromosome segregation ATPase
MKTIEELEAELETVTRERHELRARLVDAVQERNAARTDWEVCALNLAEVTRERDLSLFAWESAGMQGRTAQSAMLELARQLDEARETILALTTAKAEADLEIAILTTALDERDVEAERSLEQYDRLVRERDEARAEVERLTDASTHWQVMCKREGEEIERLARQVELLTDERDELLVRVANQDAELRATREAYRDAYRRLCAPMWEEP